MVEFGIDVVALTVAGLGAAYGIGATWQRVRDLEVRVSVIEKAENKIDALLMDIRERVIVIEQCLSCKAKPVSPE